MECSLNWRRSAPSRSWCCSIRTCPGQAEQCGGVGEGANDVGAAFDLVHAFQWVRGSDLSPVLGREPADREDVVLRVLEHVRDLRVRPGGPVRGAFERSRTNERGSFRIDQLLMKRFRRDADPVGEPVSFSCLRSLRREDLLRAIVRCVLTSRFLDSSLTIARWLTHVYDAANPIRISTTPGDVTSPLTPARSPAARCGHGCRRGSGARSRCPDLPGRRAPSLRSACRGRTGMRRRSPW